MLDRFFPKPKIFRFLILILMSSSHFACLLRLEDGQVATPIALALHKALKKHPAEMVKCSDVEVPDIYGFKKMKKHRKHMNLQEFG